MPITDTAAAAVQQSITRRRPKRRVAAGEATVPTTPPSAETATSQPTTSGPMPRAVSISAVNGKVLPTPMPRTATLTVTATKSRQMCLSSMGWFVLMAALNAPGRAHQRIRAVAPAHLVPHGCWGGVAGPGKGVDGLAQYANLFAPQLKSWLYSHMDPRR